MAGIEVATGELMNGNRPECVDLLQSLPELPQRQDSTRSQIRDLWKVANKLGMYDAADLIKPMCGIYYDGLTIEESKEFDRILTTVISELSKEEIEYFKLLNDRILDAIPKRC